MKKQEIALFKDALGTIKAGVDMLNKLVDTSEQQESDHTDEENLNEMGKDPRKKDPDNHQVEQLNHETDEEIAENRIEFCKAVLEDNETTTIIGFCCNNDTHEAYGRVNIQMDLLKEMAQLYLMAHE